jgi:tetratricopeptide (TPR) repeat protein
MILPVTERQSHSNRSICGLKPTIPLLLAAVVPLACAWQQRSAEPPLRRELTRLVESGETELALARAQAALRLDPDDPDVRREYVSLHVALARSWIAQRRFEDCLAAVDAILAVEPANPSALEIRRRIDAARERAARQIPEIDRLLRLELFDSALERVREVAALRPDLSGKLAGRRQAAWRGCADDHFFAANFAEAFALYENLWSFAEDTAPELPARWGLTLALALGRHAPGQPLAPESCAPLRERLSRDSSIVKQPLVMHALLGLLAERDGQQPAAGPSYAAALGVAWQDPPNDQRRATVAELRARVLGRLEALHASDHIRPRDGAWQISLPDVWKQRDTGHFEVRARNDVVAERVAEAAEVHLAGLCDWLGMVVPDTWEPRCALHIHATADGLRAATEEEDAARGPAEAPAAPPLQIRLCQADPWLLSGTLPRELTRVLLAQAGRAPRLPWAISEGLGLAAEPPARRLALRRLLSTSTPEPAGLLTATRLPENDPGLSAACEELTAFLSSRAGASPSDPDARPPVVAVLQTFRNGCPPAWWAPFGWESEAAALEDWRAWHAAYRNPPRIPLMILTRPGAPAPARRP